MSSVEKPAYTNKAVLEKYLSLPQGPRVCATYVWIDGSGEGMRSKVKCLDSKPSKVEDLPVWNYDGSSCYQVSHLITYQYGVSISSDVNIVCYLRLLATIVMSTFIQSRCTPARSPRETISSSSVTRITTKMSQ